MKVLVTLNGSELSEAALKPARKIADGLNAEVHLLRVSERAPRGTIGPERDPGLIRGAEIGVIQPTVLADALAPHPPTGESEREEIARSVAEQAEQELRQFLAEKASVFGDRAVKLEVSLAGTPAETIIDHARRDAVDYIVMATHGRSGLSALVQGSVAGEVVRSGVAPVVLIRSRPSS